MRNITHIIIHCSDSAWGCAREIDKWHKERGWFGIGYHFVILNGIPEFSQIVPVLNGSIECGRKIEEVGAHCLGYNENSLGICLILKDSPMIEQLNALKELVRNLCSKYSIPVKNVLGHCETESGKKEGKTCPNFDVESVRSWLKGRV